MKVPSLSLRLALWVGLLGLLQAAAVLLFSHATLEQELAAQRRSVLRDKADQARHLVGDMASDAAIRASSSGLIELVTGHAEQHLGVARQGSTQPTVASSREAGESLQRLKDDVWATDAFLEWRAQASDAPMLSLAASVQTKNGEVYEIVVSIDRSEDQRLLRSLLLTALTAAPFALALVSISALAIVGLGLRPLWRFQKTATEITADNLSARIDAQGLPAELQALCQAFNAMLGRLDEGVRRLSDFSSDLAHELRTPLATLLGRTQVALSQPRGVDELIDVLEGNGEEVQRLSRLVADMLFLAHVEHAQAALEMVEVDLGEEATEVAEFLEILARDREVSIVVEGTAKTRADRNQVRRAITNLLSNAVRHCAFGTPVRVRVHAHDGSAVLDVINEGDPIPVQHQPRIFDRFYRVDSARARDLGGTGLGLAIVKAIMVLHRGSVAVESVPSGPTRFTLRFPSSSMER